MKRNRRDNRIIRRTSERRRNKRERTINSKWSNQRCYSFSDSWLK
jgi:hypothetical protein